MTNAVTVREFKENGATYTLRYNGSPNYNGKLRYYWMKVTTKSGTISTDTYKTQDNAEFAFAHKEHDANFWFRDI